MSAHRQAALALHGLNQRDQDSILTNLPPQDQRILRQFLAELKNLGFEADSTREFSDNLPAMLVKQGTDVPINDPTSCLYHASATAMLAVLEAEPAGLVAQILRIKKWPWHEDFLQLCSAPRRELIRSFDENHQQDVQVAQALQQALLHGTAQKLRSYRPPVPAPQTPWQAFKKKVMAWMR